VRIAVLGATGLVGRTMLNLLEEATFITGDPVLLSSANGAGTRMPFRERELECHEVAAEHFAGVDIALFSAGGGPSLEWAPLAREQGVWVVDNSSAWRMDDTVPLVVPEINGNLVSALEPGHAGGIIANPNCSTIQVALAVAPLHAVFGVREAHVTTLQAVSGGGQATVAALMHEEAGEPDTSGAFPRPIHRNVIPAIGTLGDDGSYEEEVKVVRELRKILGRGADLAVSCTATRVPVVNGHSAAIRLVCDRPFVAATAQAALADFPGVESAAGPGEYLTPLEIDGSRSVHVGRLRPDPTDPCALLCWVVADNLLKGAAWNAVQIAGLLAGKKSG